MKQAENLETVEVSVIIPVYNVEEFLEECLVSLVHSSIFSMMEVILIDDGSTDGSRSIGEKYAEQYSNIHILSFQNGGISKARNRGMRLAKGRYLFFIDGDDTLEEQYIEKLYQRAVETDCDVVYGGFTQYQEDGSTKLFKKEILQQTQEIMRGTDYLEKRMDLDDRENQVWCALYNRDFLEKNDLYFHEDVRLYEDILFTNEVMVKAMTVSSVCDYGYLYRYRVGSLVRVSQSYRDVSALMDIIGFIVEGAASYTEREKHAMGRELFYVMTMYAFYLGRMVYKDKNITSDQKKELDQRLKKISPWKLLRMSRTGRREKMKYWIFRLKVESFYLLTRK